MLRHLDRTSEPIRHDVLTESYSGRKISAVCIWVVDDNDAGVETLLSLLYGMTVEMIVVLLTVLLICVIVDRQSLVGVQRAVCDSD